MEQKKPGTNDTFVTRKLKDRQRQPAWTEVRISYIPYEWGWDGTDLEGQGQNLLRYWKHFLDIWVVFNQLHVCEENRVLCRMWILYLKKIFKHLGEDICSFF